MSELTTEMVRIGHVTSAESDARFTRWIAKVKADALREAAEHSVVTIDAENGYRFDAVGKAWLLAEAALIELNARQTSPDALPEEEL